MIPECVNCKNIFTCAIKNKPKGESCVMFKERKDIEKHLKIEIKGEKQNNKVSQKQYEKFMDLLKVGELE